MRPDRDEHVIIHWENMNPSVYNNFAKVEGNGWTTFDTPYNYMSVMHYSGTGFSINGELTIETLDPFYQNLIGQRASFTIQDTKNIEMIYQYDPNDADKLSCNCESFELSGAE